MKTMVITAMNTEMNQLFDFYLDAWAYCLKHKIPLNRIKKNSFRTWRIELKGVKKNG